MKKLVLTILAALAAAAVAVGCGDSNADKVNENLGKKCERFECQRRIVGVNGITDKVLFEAVGRCSIEQNDALPANLEVVCKHGPDDYRKHFVGLADNVTWVSTQLQGLDVSEYRTKFTFRPESLVPDLDLVTGDSP